MHTQILHVRKQSSTKSNIQSMIGMVYQIHALIKHGALKQNNQPIPAIHDTSIPIIKQQTTNTYIQQYFIRSYHDRNIENTFYHLCHN